MKQFFSAIVLGAVASLTTSAAAQWSDNFDSYTAGTNAVGQGGWEEWTASPGAGALVSSAQSYSTANSIDITGPTDLVRQYTGYTSGTWEYTTRQYIPSGTTGKPYFILLSQYGAANTWAVQVAFNPVTGDVEADAGGGLANNAKLVYDKWVEIQVVIHLDDDWTQFYYNGILLDSTTVADHPVHGGGWKWTAGPFGTSTGPVDIAAVDLYANSSTSVFYDDFRLRKMNLGVRPYGDATPGANGSPVASSMGDAVGTNLLFGLQCDNGPANANGYLAFTVEAFPSGMPLLGINLLIDPTLFIYLYPVTTDAAGKTSTPIPLLPSNVGSKVFCQYAFAETNGGLSASNALDIHVLQ